MWSNYSKDIWITIVLIYNLEYDLLVLKNDAEISSDI